MKRIKIIAGITWAILCLILILILFPGIDSMKGTLSKLPFMKINPNYTGGETAYQIISQACTLDIRKPVFDGLLKERRQGFVHIDWRGTVPEEISDTIDYNMDALPDFYIRINTGSNITDLTPFNKNIERVKVSTPTSYGWAVRIGLHKPD